MPNIVRITLLLLLAATPQKLGIAFDSWHYDFAGSPPGAAIGTLTITMVNTSHKNITAFASTQDITFTDGTHSTGERLTDLLAQDRVLAPGETYDLKTVGTTPVLNVSIVPDVAIYSDHTADVLNQSAFNHILQTRQEVLLAYERVNELIRESAGKPREDIAAQLEKEAALASIRTSSDPVPLGGTLKHLAQQLRESADLGAFTKQNDERIAFWNGHLHPAVQP